jgi:hypothetical protein
MPSSSSSSKSSSSSSSRWSSTSAKSSSGSRWSKSSSSGKSSQSNSTQHQSQPTQSQPIPPPQLKTPGLSAPPPPVISVPSPSIPSRPGIFDTVLEGFAWGTGTSIARRIFSPGPSSLPEQNSQTPEIYQNHQIPIKSNPTDQPNLSQMDPSEIFRKYQECLDISTDDNRIQCESININIRVQI